MTLYLLLTFKKTEIMANKKANLPTLSSYETIFDAYLDDEHTERRSITIFVEYTGFRPTAIDVLVNDCGESCKEYYGDWDIEKYLHIRGKAALKLAGKLAARDRKTLLRRMADQFRRYGYDALDKMEDWLTSKDIEYTTSMY